MKKQRDKYRFTLSFGTNDKEAQQWLFAQEHKSAYLKKLIQEDMQAKVNLEKQED